MHVALSLAVHDSCTSFYDVGKFQTITERQVEEHCSCSTNTCFYFPTQRTNAKRAKHVDNSKIPSAGNYR
jgi:hypothetical protein